MIKVDKRLKYIFKEAPHHYFSDDEFEARADKLCFFTFKKQEIPKGIEDDDWELLHLDGDIGNCALDNLELITFEDDPLLKLKTDIKELKQELSLKNEKIKNITFESKAKDGKVENMSRQVTYEQNRNKELCKEIKELEKEIRRLFKIIESRKE